MNDISKFVAFFFISYFSVGPSILGEIEIV